MVLSALGLYKEQDEFYWKIIMQYLTLLVIGILIATNLQSFMKNFIVSLKNILKDSSVRVSYNSTILIFSFVSFSFLEIVDNGYVLLVHNAAAEPQSASCRQRSVLEPAGQIQPRVRALHLGHIFHNFMPDLDVSAVL